MSTESLLWLVTLILGLGIAICFQRQTKINLDKAAGCDETKKDIDAIVEAGKLNKFVGANPNKYDYGEVVYFVYGNEIIIAPIESPRIKIDIDKMSWEYILDFKDSKTRELLILPENMIFNNEYEAIKSVIRGIKIEISDNFNRTFAIKKTVENIYKREERIISAQNEIVSLLKEKANEATCPDMKTEQYE